MPVAKLWVGAGRKGVHYWCQGCREVHGIVYERDDGAHPCWGWNGSLEKPTFSPSVLTTGIKYEIDKDGDADWDKPVRDANGDPVKLVCHTFITDGMVQFLADCGHEFAGQTLPLPELPKWLADEPSADPVSAAD